MTQNKGMKDEEETINKIVWKVGVEAVCSKDEMIVFWKRGSFPTGGRTLTRDWRASADWPTALGVVELKRPLRNMRLIISVPHLLTCAYNVELVIRYGIGRANRTKARTKKCHVPVAGRLKRWW